MMMASCICALLYRLYSRFSFDDPSSIKRAPNIHRAADAIVYFMVLILNRIS